jgi:hypothetical protein
MLAEATTQAVQTIHVIDWTHIIQSAIVAIVVIVFMYGFYKIVVSCLGER